MDVAQSSEMLASYHKSTECYDPEDLHLNPHRREDLKTRNTNDTLRDYHDFR